MNQSAFLRIPLPLRRHCHTRRAQAPICSLSEIAQRVRSRESSAESEVLTCLSRIASQDDQIKSFLSVDGESAISRARQIDEVVYKGEDPGPLCGVPIAVKDNICVRNGVTTAGSRILDDFVSSYSATTVQRLEAAGAIIIGKTNLDEFGMGSSTENSAYFPTANPWDATRVPGGSSGGSAAAVSARLVPAALGSDTGGSIRLPASYCGVTGLKPSYGRVSRHGLLAYASSLDTIGPMTGSARDAALVLQAIAGTDAMDATCAPDSVPDYIRALSGDLKGVVVGVVEDALTDGVDSDVRAAVRAAVRTLESLGATTRPVALPSLDAATAAYYVLATSEASANLARYDGVRYGTRSADAQTAREVYTRSRADGLGQEVKKRIMLGTFALSSGYYEAYYRKAQRVRARVAADFGKLFNSGVDVLVSPVAPTPAFRLGEKTDDQVKMYLDDIMNVPASLSGLPALSVPCGFASGILPVGLQIIGPYMREDVVLNVGHAFQTCTEFHLQQPSVAEAVAV